MKIRNIEKLNELIGEIIELEEKFPNELDRINEKIDIALKFIIDSKLESVCDGYYLKYLDDGGIRQKDKEYAKYQTRKIKKLIDIKNK